MSYNAIQLTTVSMPQRDRPYPGGVASRLETFNYVAMVMLILYDNSYCPNDSNLKYESYSISLGLMVDLKKSSN